MSVEGYGVCRSVEDAKQIAAGAESQGLKGCYPAASVVLARALKAAEKRIAEIEIFTDALNQTKSVEFANFYDKDLAK
jgi:urease alpha subunit